MTAVWCWVQRTRFWWAEVGCFFFKQKTAYEMRISDWSSDLCSSDRQREPDQQGAGKIGRAVHLVIGQPADRARDGRLGQQRDADDERRQFAERVDDQPLPHHLAD